MVVPDLLDGDTQCSEVDLSVQVSTLDEVGWQGEGVPPHYSPEFICVSTLWYSQANDIFLEII